MSEQQTTEGTHVKLWAQGPFFLGAECDNFTHYFNSVPGPCRCGREEWETPPKPKLRLVE